MEYNLYCRYSVVTFLKTMMTFADVDNDGDNDDDGDDDDDYNDDDDEDNDDGHMIKEIPQTDEHKGTPKETELRHRHHRTSVQNCTPNFSQLNKAL